MTKVVCFYSFVEIKFPDLVDNKLGNIGGFLRSTVEINPYLLKADKHVIIRVTIDLASITDTGLTNFGGSDKNL